MQQENFSAGKLKWRAFLRSRIENIEMAYNFRFSGLNFLKWRGFSRFSASTSPRHQDAKFLGFQRTAASRVRSTTESFFSVGKLTASCDAMNFPTVRKN